MGARGEGAANVMGQAAAGLIVVNPALLGPVEVEPYAAYREAARAIARGLAWSGTPRRRDPDRSTTRDPSAVPPPSSRHGFAPLRVHRLPDLQHPFTVRRSSSSCAFW